MGHNSQSKGHDFIVNLQDNGVHAGDGEHIRMYLTNLLSSGNHGAIWLEPRVGPQFLLLFLRDRAAEAYAGRGSARASVGG